MPRRDGTGPAGLGAMTGRGLGNCSNLKAAKHIPGYGISMGTGLGLARRRGFGGGFRIKHPQSIRIRKNVK